MEEKDKCVPYWPVVSILVLSLVGIVIAGELVKIHIKVYTDPSYHSFCALSEGINCETVAESPYAVFWFLPVAVWGILGYLLIISLVVWNIVLRKKKKEEYISWASFILLGIAIFSMIVDLILGYISHIVIHSLCILCMSSYFVNFLILILAILNIKYLPLGFKEIFLNEFRFIKENKFGFSLWSISWVLVLFLLYLFYPRYWTSKLSEPEMEDNKLQTGVTKDGYPWIGNPNGVEIEEFSDYQCPYCRRAHQKMRELLLAFPDKIKLIHHHYPLDHHCNPLLRGRPFHPIACFLSKIAICAQKEGKFWEANDLLFEYQLKPQRPTIEKIAEELGIDKEKLKDCVNSTETEEFLKREINLGIKLNIMGTPTYKVGERLYPGMIPQQILEEIILH